MVDTSFSCCLCIEQTAVLVDPSPQGFVECAVDYRRRQYLTYSCFVSCRTPLSSCSSCRSLRRHTIERVSVRVVVKVAALQNLLPAFKVVEIVGCKNKISDLNILKAYSFVTNWHIYDPSRK
ncbi:uncharacterized protein PHALS_10878 [Plasmopara halstedii]|uniref:Uncharacterized protein n=1 Tax=Plasmopara halstedii TaxID=4781 RepID=A0A0P1AIT0_PLAHL|nr:uncharacterized protein PHALS_10878 [Plasmopara halstedii]CEG40694.1 hypothetical protein PHALS_10878 [Plasmopara halstedii]|eukprot:XP_024577063.1 hypothetical protein PHALS_10878 [Plasmopara halstedii]